MIVHMPNINSSTIVSVFNDVDPNINFPPITLIASLGVIAAFVVVVAVVAFEFTVPKWLLSFVVALFALNGILSSMPITSLALSFIHSLDGSCSIPRSLSLCCFVGSLQNGRVETRSSSEKQEKENQMEKNHDRRMKDNTIVRHSSGNGFECSFDVWKINNVGCSILSHCT